MADAVTGAATTKVTSEAGPQPFVLFEMDRTLAHQVQNIPGGVEMTPERSSPPEDAAPPPFTIQPGDTVSVSIVSVDTSGFIDFSQSAVTPLSTTTLPPQIVAADGRIQVPPLGRVAASGVSPQGLERRLLDRLTGVLIEPSVVVQITDRQSARASVMGKVASPGSIPLLRDNYRLIDLIALAGGPSEQVEDQVVALNRNGIVTRMRLSKLFADPAYNVRVWPADIITIEGARRRFVAIGSFGAIGMHDFDRPEYTLSDALGESGGLLPNAGARNGVFVYRNIPASTLATFGADGSAFNDGVAPAIFHFDFLDPTMLFAAGEFKMADGDVIYISDTLTEEISKVFATVSRVISPVSLRGPSVTP